MRLELQRICRARMDPQQEQIDLVIGMELQYGQIQAPLDLWTQCALSSNLFLFVLNEEGGIETNGMGVAL